MHDRSCLARKVYACHIHQPELPEIVVEPVHSQPQPDINEYRIARILNALDKSL